jgi:hypothetical protein
MNEEILEITKKFHDTYEKLSKEYNYETKKETRVFDINSSNGKLMYATVNEIISPVLEENQNLKKQLENKYEKVGTLTSELLYEENTKLINQQKEFIKYMNSCIKELEKESQNKLQNTINLGIIDITKTILQKYKEIIGEDK